MYEDLTQRGVIVGKCLEVSEINTSFTCQGAGCGTVDIAASTISHNVEIRIQVSVCMLV